MSSYELISPLKDINTTLEKIFELLDKRSKNEAKVATRNSNGRGITITISGPTASGKTTIAALLMAFFKDKVDSRNLSYSTIPENDKAAMQVYRAMIDMEEYDINWDSNTKINVVELAE